MSPDARRTRLVLDSEDVVPIFEGAPAVGGQASSLSISSWPMEFDKSLEEARQAGFEEGRAAGISEATNPIEMKRVQALQSLVDAVEAAVKAVHEQRHGVVDEVVHDVATLAIDLTEALVDCAIRDKEALQGTIVRAIRLAPEGDDIVITLAEDNPLSDEEIVSLTSIPGARVRRDPSLDPIGCTIEVGACHIDAQRSAALARVREEIEAVSVAPRGKAQ